jgi:hypothetical protein
MDYIGARIGIYSCSFINLIPNPMFTCKIIFGETKLYNYSKVKDPKNPPGIEALSLNRSSIAAMNRILQN